VEFSFYLGKLGDQIVMPLVLSNVAWVPCNLELSNNRLFDLSSTRDKAIERFVEANDLLTEKGFSSNTVDLCNLTQIDVIIFYSISSDVGYLIRAVKKNPHLILINIPIEPTIVSFFHVSEVLSMMPFDRIMVWNDDLVDKGLPYVKANIGEPMIYRDSIPSTPYKDKAFLVAIYSNKLVVHENGLYEERLMAFDYFCRRPEGLDLYGMGWDDSKCPAVLASYKGRCESKIEVLKKYKFSICFENSQGDRGLITEKIFDCFAAGSVPIYYGASNIQEYIPKACFIDFRDFDNYDELYRHLVKMTGTDYQSHLDAVKLFVCTSEYYEFTSKRYAELILEQVELLTNDSRSNRSVLSFKWSLLKIVLAHPLLFLNNIKGCRRFLFDLVSVW